MILSSRASFGLPAPRRGARKHRQIVERLFGAGHIKLLCATETFALGVNMPARSVAFEGVFKWDGKGRVPLKTREYQQMAGRAGRRGIDAEGSVYLTFDPLRDEPQLFGSMVNGKVEPVRSQFNLSYGTLLNLYQHLGEAIYEACERSFANYVANGAIQRGDHDSASSSTLSPMRGAVRRVSAPGDTQLTVTPYLTSSRAVMTEKAAIPALAAP